MSGIALDSSFSLLSRPWRLPAALGTETPEFALRAFWACPACNPKISIRTEDSSSLRRLALLYSLQVACHRHVTRLTRCQARKAEEAAAAKAGQDYCSHSPSSEVLQERLSGNQAENPALCATRRFTKTIPWTEKMRKPWK